MASQKRVASFSSTMAAVDEEDITSYVLDEALNIHGLRVTWMLIANTAGDQHDCVVALLCTPPNTQTPDLSHAVIDNEPLPEQVWFWKRVLVTDKEMTRIEFEPQTSRSCPRGSNLKWVTRRATPFTGTGVVRHMMSSWWWENQI